MKHNTRGPGVESRSPISALSTVGHRAMSSAARMWGVGAVIAGVITLGLVIAASVPSLQRLATSPLIRLIIFIDIPLLVGAWLHLTYWRRNIATRRLLSVALACLLVLTDGRIILAPFLPAPIYYVGWVASCVTVAWLCFLLLRTIHHQDSLGGNILGAVTVYLAVACLAVGNARFATSAESLPALFAIWRSLDLAWKLGFVSWINAITPQLSECESATIRRYDPQLAAERPTKLLQRREIGYFFEHVLLMAAFGTLGLFGTLRGVPVFDVITDVSQVAMVSLVFYYLFRDAIRGKSIGKLLTCTRVVDSSTGRPISISQSVMRNWLLLVPLMPLVELLVANIRQDKRRLGDLLADTVVVRDRF